MNEPFRLHPGTLLEGDIQGQIIAYLRHEQARGRVVWFERSNGGGGRVAGRWTMDWSKNNVHGKPAQETMFDKEKALFS
jgi:hypothetical protein